MAKNKMVGMNLSLPEQIDSLQDMFNQLQSVAFSFPMNDPENELNYSELLSVQSLGDALAASEIRLPSY